MLRVARARTHAVHAHTRAYTRTHASERDCVLVCVHKTSGVCVRACVTSMPSVCVLARIFVCVVTLGKTRNEGLIIKVTAKSSIR